MRAAHRLSRKRPGEAGKAERRNRRICAEKANRGRGHGLARKLQHSAGLITTGVIYLGQYSSGLGWLLHRARRNAAGLPVGGACGRSSALSPLHGKAGGQLVFQHDPGRVPDGAVGLRGGGWAGSTVLTCGHHGATDAPGAGLLITNSMRDIIYGDTNPVSHCVQLSALAIALGSAWQLIAGMAVDRPSPRQPGCMEVRHVVFVGCCGFCILFNTHGRGHGAVHDGAGEASGCSICCAGRWAAMAYCNLFAALLAAVYAETMARLRGCGHAYLVIAILPMLPGAGVYYTMSLGLEGGKTMEGRGQGAGTLGIAGSLAVGILLVSTVFRLVTWGRKGWKAACRSSPPALLL